MVDLRQIIARRGLRVRIAAIVAATVCLALAAGGFAVERVLRDRLDEVATRSAQSRAEDIAALATNGILPAQLSLPGENAALVQVVDIEGVILATTENVRGKPLVIHDLPAPTKTRTSTVTVPSLGERVRIYAITIPIGAANIVTVIAGEPLAPADDTIRKLVTWLILAFVPIAGLVTALSWWAVGRTLRPVAAISSAMSEITATDLQRRVPHPSSRDEIGELAESVNATLGRLETSVERQKRFVADASHELRGPLAALRADLEISLAHPHLTDWTEMATGALSDVERLQNLTQDLLQLARLDAVMQERRSDVDLGAIVRDEAERNRRPGVSVLVPADPAPLIQGVRQQLGQVVANLIANAVRHARTRVEVGIAAVPDSVVLRVDDDGDGVPDADRERVFERFVRLDDARTPGTGSTGLGLAIAREVVLSHGGSISVEESRLGGASFVVVLPTGR